MTILAKDQEDTHKYITEQKMGEQAGLNQACPFSNRQIGKRCAWLAGVFDTHGFHAWALARNKYHKTSKSD